MQALVREPDAENVPFVQATTVASVVDVQGTVVRWPGPADEHAGQVLACVPEAEKVPAAQAAMTALDVDVQSVVTRWPGPAVEHAEHVGLELATGAKKEPLVHTHAVKAPLGAELERQAVQLAAPAAEKVLPLQVAHVEVVVAALFALYVPAVHCVQVGFAALVLL